MNRFSKFVLGGIVVLSVIFSSCKHYDKNGPLHVEVVKNGSKYQLLVNGEPYFIKGAGLEFGDIPSLAKAGANSFRTWRVDNGKRSAKEILDEAQKYGLTVMMGLDFRCERHGFDYSDTAFVAKQKEKLRKEVLSIKDHPALLAWCIGNELNYLSKNKKIWSDVDDIAKMIKEIDGNHPCTTPLAGFNKSEIEYIVPMTPHLDFLSMQMYGDMVLLQQRIRESGYIGLPYVVTEWGPVGTWEVKKTTWGVPIEQSSSEKAAFFKKVYDVGISQDLDNNLGSYVFLWGQKQETTPTWYGLFTDSNYKTECVDLMEEIWTGKRPENNTPRIKNVTVDGKKPDSSIRLSPGKEYLAVIETEDIDGDPLTFQSEILAESTDIKVGGDKESRPETILDADVETSHNGIKFIAPNTNGAYRLFVYVLDGKGAAGYVNIPFYVE